MNDIYIIGTGLAGYTLARELRKLDPDVAISLVTSDDGSFYSKPMLSNALAKNKQAHELATANAEKMQNDLNIRVISNTLVEYIDRDKRKIITQDGELSYAKLVLALGANPIVAPIEGEEKTSILSVNNLVDYSVFRNKLSQVKTLSIIGPGLIGCEFANDLISAGYPVNVIGPDKNPLGRLLPFEVGQYVLEILQKAGIKFHLNTVVQRIDRNNKNFVLTLADGHSLESELVLSAIGLRPNTALASTSNLTVEKGIVVDRYLMSNDKNIFALGDCTEVAGQVLPFVMPIMHAARALAKTLTGEPSKVKYPAMPVVVKTPACPLVVSPPTPGCSGKWEIENNGDGIRALFSAADNSLQGFALAGAATKERQQLTALLPDVLD